jgi:S1-C subfamily serine protease
VGLVLRPLAAACALLALVSAADARPWGWLGVRIRDLSEQEMEDISRRHGLREGFGVLIVEVMADTPAARAGLKNGDLVVAFNGRPVVDTRMLQRLIASASLGDEAKVTVLRPETGRRALTVQLAAMPPDVAGDRVAAEFGFLTREPVPEGEPARRLVGLVVPSVSVVARGSSAEEAGLRVGDVILSVNEAAVISREALRVALAEVPLDRPLRLSVRREGAVLSLSLAPSERR